MRTRRLLWTVPLTAVGVLGATVALTAHGQDAPGTGAKFYQGKVSPGVPTPSGTKVPATNSPRPVFTTPPSTATNGNNRPRITQPVIAGADGVRQAGGAEAMPAFTPLPSPSLPAASPPGLAAPSTGTNSPLGPPRIVVEGGAGTEAPAVPSLAPAMTPAVSPAPASTEPKPLAITPTTAKDDTLPPFSFETQPPKPAVPPPAAATPTEVPKAAPTAKPMTPTVPAAPTAHEAPTTPAANATPLPSRQTPNVTVEVVAPESTGVGQPMTYELVVRNIGTSAVTNLRVEDDPPARTALVGSEPAAETSGNRLSWSLGTLESGAEKRIKITVKPSEEGAISSRATVSFASAVDLNVKVTRPRITVAVVGPEVARVGEKVPFQIKLTNTGSGAASRVQLQARFSDGLTHPSGQLIEAELANLPAGQSKTLTLEAIAGRSGGQTCTMTATAEGNQPETAKAALNLVEPMLQVKQTGPAKCLVKSEPVFQIELSNPGTAATDPVQVWASLPAGFEFVQASDNGALADANKAVGWRLPAMAAGSTKSLTLKLRAVAPAEGTVRTTALATSQADAVQQAGGVPTEPRTAVKGLEAKAESAIKVEGVPALRFEVVDVEDPIMVGRDAVYEVRVVNQGTGACTNVQIIADLSEGTTATGATGPTNGRLSGQQIVFEPIPDLGVKAEAVYRVRVKGGQAGDHHFRVRLACDQIRTPVVKEENTRFYKE